MTVRAWLASLLFVIASTAARADGVGHAGAPPAIARHGPRARDAAQRAPVPNLLLEGVTDTRGPLEIVAIDAAYGGLAGALVGGGVALIEQGHWWRDISVGAGAGILVGAIVGGVHAASVADRERLARDGLGSPERDPPRAGVHTVLSWSGGF